MVVFTDILSLSLSLSLYTYMCIYICIYVCVHIHTYICISYIFRYYMRYTTILPNDCSPCAIDVYIRGELRQSSSMAHHNFHLARSIPLLKNHLLFANHSLQPPFLLSLLYLLLPPLLPLSFFLLFSFHYFTLVLFTRSILAIAAAGDAR